MRPRRPFPGRNFQQPSRDRSRRNNPQGRGGDSAASDYSGHRAVLDLPSQSFATIARGKRPRAASPEKSFMPTRSTPLACHAPEGPRANGSVSPTAARAGLSPAAARCVAWLTLVLIAGGCTTPSEYVHNGFKVGPNYCPPGAAVADNWIDAADKRVRTESDDLSEWWHVFNDPVLEGLVHDAYQQNLTLREAGFRVLAARAQVGIAIGNLFPQQQYAFGDYSRTTLSTQTANNIVEIGSEAGLPTQRNFSQWDYGFGLGWELDFWGRFRRAVEANEATLGATVGDYDDVLVTLMGDVAYNYVLYRTLQEQIAFARYNVDLQRQTLTIVEARFRAGTTGELDVHQSRSTLAQTEAAIPELEISLRQAANRLCILMGIPPQDLQARLGTAPIPTAPKDAAVGIPAELLSRRPDIRRAERTAAAQSAQIGIAESDFYPAISIVGTIGYSAEEFPNLFRQTAFDGTIGPSFNWKILNYGRILNNVREQQAKFQALVTDYQQTVLTADREVEDGIVTFLRAQTRTQFQTISVDRAQKAVALGLVQYQAGTVDFTRITQLEQNLVLQQNTLAQARGEIAQGLIQTYRALGGGWQFRLTGQDPGQPTANEVVPTNVPPAPPASPGPASPAPIAQPVPAPPPAATSPAKPPVPSPGR
jgi:NodT family efflux transporter outer membrane factor (OMF) lipoprotein